MSIEAKRRAGFEEWASMHGYDLLRDGVVVAYASARTDALWQAWNSALDSAIVDTVGVLEVEYVGHQFSKCRDMTEVKIVRLQSRAAQRWFSHHMDGVITLRGVEWVVLGQRRADPFFIAYDYFLARLLK